MTRRKFEAEFLPTVHSFWVFFDCTFLDNSTVKIISIKNVMGSWIIKYDIV